MSEKETKRADVRRGSELRQRLTRWKEHCVKRRSSGLSIRLGPFPGAPQCDQGEKSILFFGLIEEEHICLQHGDVLKIKMLK